MEGEHILKQCIDIIYKYPELFPISDSARKLYTEDWAVKYFIERDSGISYCFKHKFNAMNEFWWMANPKRKEYDLLINLLIKSVIVEFAKRFPNLEDHKLWKKMIKTEKL